MTARASFRHEHGDNPVRLTSDADVDQLVDNLLTEDFGNSVAAIYANGRLNAAGVPDHELLVGIDSEGGVGSLRYMGESATFSGTFYGSGQPSKRDEVFYYYMGHDRVFPADAELSIDAIRKALKEFVTSNGDRPTSIEWSDWPEGMA
jgi:hypothetical protein